MISFRIKTLSSIFVKLLCFAVRNQLITNTNFKTQFL